MSAEYKGCPSGRIGFAFHGEAMSVCPMSKFSEVKRSQVSEFGTPWINVVFLPVQEGFGHYLHGV